MKKLQPNIDSFDRAMEFLITSPHLRFYFFDSGYDNFVLSGGLLSHRVSISLIQGASNPMDDVSDPQSIHRIVINDGGYKTMYAIQNREFNSCLQKMYDLAEAHSEKLKLMYKKKQELQRIINIVHAHGIRIFITDKIYDPNKSKTQKIIP